MRTLHLAVPIIHYAYNVYVVYATLCSIFKYTADISGLFKPFQCCNCTTLEKTWSDCRVGDNVSDASQIDQGGDEQDGKLASAILQKYVA